MSEKILKRRKTRKMKYGMKRRVWSRPSYIRSLILVYGSNPSLGTDRDGTLGSVQGIGDTELKE